MISPKVLFLLGFFHLPEKVGAQWGPVPEDACDFGRDALTNAFGKYIPRTCFDVPISDDGSTTEVQKRCYYTYIPDSCSASSQKVPLVVDVHDFSSCPLASASYTGWREKSEEECFVVMWPSGLKDRFLDGGCFHVPAFLKDDVQGTVATAPCCCTDQAVATFLDTDEGGRDDTLFLRMAIDSVQQSLKKEKSTSLSIDDSRIYMAGHANGCMASLAMAAKYSDTIAAASCHGGTIVTPFAEDYTPVPIWMAVGVKDDFAPYEGQGNSVGSSLIPQLNNVGMWSMNNTISYLARKNDCSEEEELDVYEADNIIGTISKRGNCTNNANVEVVTLFESGHTPYNLPPYWADLVEAQGETLTTIDTTAMAWEFCSSYTKSSTHSALGSSNLMEESSAPRKERQGIIFGIAMIAATMLGIPAI